MTFRLNHGKIEYQTIGEAVAKNPTEGKDFLGNSLAPGDLVAFTQVDSSTLYVGRVDGFTPKTIRVDIIDLENHQRSTLGGWRGRKVTRHPNQLIKLPNNEEYYRDLPKAWLAKILAPAIDEAVEAKA